MILDCRGRVPAEWQPKRVFVNDVEIHQVWYVDTEAGFILTYDVLGDGKAHATCERINPEVILRARELDIQSGIGAWAMPPAGAMSKMIHGSIRLEDLCSPAA
jgi:hypothetical protein